MTADHGHRQGPGPLSAGRDDAVAEVAPAGAAEEMIAHRVQDRTHGRWVVWFGRRTGRYWAMPRRRDLNRLLEARTPEGLLAAMGEIDAFYGGRAER
jgi:hypothetical protein